MSEAGGEADAEWAPPAPPGPVKQAQLKLVPGAAVQTKLGMQACICPVCAQPPAAGAYTAQRKNFSAHFKKKHQGYTFMDIDEAAAMGSKPIGYFFSRVAHAAGVCAPIISYSIQR